MHESPTWEQFWNAWELFGDAVLCAVVVGLVLGFLGIYIVTRRMVFVSAAVTQAAGLGIAGAFFLEIHLGWHVNPVLGASLMALTTTGILAMDASKWRIPRESLLGLAFAFAGGAAVLVGDRISQEAHDIQSILFGTAVMVRPEDLTIVAVLGAVFALVHLVGFRGFTFASFDPRAARVQRVPVKLLNAALFASIGAMVGVSARALGALPVFAFSVLPATGVLLLGVRMPWAFAASAVVGAACGAGGYMVAFFYEFPVGGSQTVTTSLFVFVALIINGARRALQR